MPERDVLPPESRERIVRILRREGASRIAVFGSWARGTPRPESDVDVLVRFSTPKGFPDLVRIERELSESIGRRVDLVTENALSPYIREHVLREMEVLAD